MEMFKQKPSLFPESGIALSIHAGRFAAYELVVGSEMLLLIPPL
jgi:hypothetical protein